jgi:hypothetical protein
MGFGHIQVNPQQTRAMPNTNCSGDVKCKLGARVCFWKAIYHILILVAAIVVAYYAGKTVRQTERSLAIAQQSAEDSLAESKAAFEWTRQTAIMINRPVLGVPKAVLKHSPQDDGTIRLWGQVTFENTGKTPAQKTEALCSLQISNTMKCNIFEFREVEGIGSVVSIGRGRKYGCPSPGMKVPPEVWNDVETGGGKYHITLRAQATYTDMLSSDVWVCNFLASYRAARRDSAGNIVDEETWTICATGNSCD